MSGRRGGAAFGLALLAACSYSPPTQDPVAALEIAETMLQEQRFDDAVALLGAFDADDHEGVGVERWKARRARALLESGDWWGAFRQIRTFLEDHPFSPFETEVEEIEYQAGSRLIRSDWSFLFFADDAEDGQVVLEHFVRRFPRSRHKADALHLLGNRAFARGEHKRAGEWYAELRRDHPESEWAPLALFRIAISRYEALIGPEYDFEELTTTRNELAGYLAGEPENPQFVAQAQQALATVRDWLARRHVQIAEFYRRIGNAPGRQLHLEAAATEYPDTAQGQEAKRRLEGR
jgi:outer membrane protein assembly factor BamD (BamD/ComL family)